MLTSLRPSFFKNPSSFRHRISMTPIDTVDDVPHQDETDVEMIRWSVDLDQLLRRWKVQVRSRQMRHRQLSNRYAIIHYAIGLPFTVLQAIVATGNFFQAFNVNNNTGCNDSAQWILLVMGILGAISTVLSAVFMFTNNQSRSEEHSTASSNYEKLHRYIDSVLSMPVGIRGDPIDVIKDIRGVFDDVAMNSPVLAEDPIPGGTLYNPLVAKPPLPPEEIPTSQVPREETDAQALENLHHLTFTNIECEGDDLTVPFDIDEAIHNAL